MPPKQSIDKNFSLSSSDELTYARHTRLSDSQLRTALFGTIAKDRFHRALGLLNVSYTKSKATRDDLDALLRSHAPSHPSNLLEAVAIVLRPPDTRTKKQVKEWYMAQLSLHGIAFKKSGTVDDVRLKLEAAVLSNQCVSVPDSVRLIEEALLNQKHAEEKEKKERKEAKLKETWVGVICGRGHQYSELVDRYPETFNAKRLVEDWERIGNNDATAIMYVSDQDFEDLRDYLLKNISFVSMKKINTEFAPGSSHFVFGMDEKKVCALEEQITNETKQIIAQRKRKRKEEKRREREIEIAIQQQKKRAKEEKDARISSIRQKAYENSVWDIRGRWLLKSPEAENYNDRLWIMDICGKEPGDDVRYWAAYSMAVGAGHMKFKRLGHVIDQTHRTIKFRFGFRESGEGELNFGDDHIGEIEFSEHGTRMRGFMTGAYGRFNFTGDKIRRPDETPEEHEENSAYDKKRDWLPETSFYEKARSRWDKHEAKKIADSFSQYNDRTYELERIHRW